ncbi:MAG: thiamine pyrophosphate-dependent enzyme [Patescibacteria group bacterium]
MSVKAKPAYPFKPTWCTGCGNFGIWGAIKMGIGALGVPKENVVMVYDVGCSGNMADFNDHYGFHALHGRALPVAAGIKLGNQDLKVLVIMGDGGCYGEGGTHFINLMRGNHDVTLLIHNNNRYSLTTGQMSPTTRKGTKTKSTPVGSIEEPFNPIAIAASNNAGFIAREFAADIPKLSARITEAMNYDGFAMIDILQPCPVYNPAMSYEWYRENVISLESEGHQSNSREAAWKQAMRADKLATGLFYKEDKPSYHAQVKNLQQSSLTKQPISDIDISSLAVEFK